MHGRDGMLHQLAQKQVSEGLNKAGIPGIKYFDGNSRAAGEGTRNYVVFDENIMTILKRNDKNITDLLESP
jgi:hypothetical protein